MAKFGKTSAKRLSTAHEVLQILFNRVIKLRDCSITCGHRPESEQTACFRRGVSKVQWPNSKHNSLPSLAVDAVPWPEKWGSEKAFLRLKDVIEEEWAQMVGDGLTEGSRLRWGGDWDGDGDRTDQTFHDLPHWELAKPTKGVN